MSTNPPAGSDTVRRYRQAILACVDMEPATVDGAGVSVFADPGRADSGMCVCYQVAGQTVLWCDPAVADQANEFVAALNTNTSSPDEFVAWAQEQGHELVGSGVMRVLPGPLPETDPAAVPGVITLDRDVPGDAARIRAFVATCDEDDVDEADIFVDALDPVMRCALDGEGGIAAFASALPFDAAPNWWDIGVVTHADHRRKGLGLAVVRATIDGIQKAGGEALYRHDPDNTGSAAVADALGFTEACHLSAIRFS